MSAAGPLDFSGKAGLVTGAGSGLGRSAARAFAHRGAAVAVVDIDAVRSESTAATIRDAGGRASAFTVDVSDPEAVATVVGEIVQDLGRLDFAFNNAAIEGPFARAHETSIDDWRRTIDVNLSGVYYCMRAELGHMVAAGGGAIVNTSSMNGHVGTSLSVAYTAAKHGVVGMTKAAALEYARRGIRVNALCPGWMDTPMINDRVPAATGLDVLSHATKVVPMGRAGRAEELAEGAVWLCSDAASYMTGQSLLIDGGFCAG